MTDYDLGVKNAAISFLEVLKLMEIGAWSPIAATVWAEAVRDKNMAYLSHVKGVDPYSKPS